MRDESDQCTDLVSRDEPHVSVPEVPVAANVSPDAGLDRVTPQMTPLTQPKVHSHDTRTLTNTKAIVKPRRSTRIEKRIANKHGAPKKGNTE